MSQAGLSILDVDAVVAYHTRTTGPEKVSPNQAGGSTAIKTMGELGVGVVFVAGAATGAYEKTEPGLVVARAYPAVYSPLEGKAALQQGPSQFYRYPYLGLPVGERGGITAIRSRISLHLPSGIDRVVPVVNGPEAIRYDNKIVQRISFADFMAEGITVEPGMPLDEGAMAGLPDDLWLKSAKGLAGKGSHRVERRDVAEKLAQVRAEAAKNGKDDPGWVIEEHDPGLPIRGVRSLVPDLQRFIDNAESNINHEIRIHTFAYWKDGQLAIDLAPVFRYSAGNSTWVPLDPGSLPPELAAMAEHVAKTLLDKTEYQALQVASDWYLSKKANGFRMRELNVRDPAMGSWLATGEGASRLTAKEAADLGEVANREHGGRMGTMLAVVAKSAYPPKPKKN